MQHRKAENRHALGEIPGGPKQPTDSSSSREAERKPPYVMIDGFNLSLEKGTGVATYARNLSFSLRDLGYSVGVLYGSSLSPKHSPLLKEVLFYDEPPPQPVWRERWHRLRATLAPTWNTAIEVQLSGAVIANAFASKQPHFDSLWNVRDLYSKALAQFEWLGTVNTIRIKPKPLLCHWTYPLPIRMPGVPNVYTVHDLVPLRLPYTTLDRKARYLKLLTWICRTADHIVTVSENSKRDIVEILGASPERVTNTYQAVRIPDEYRCKPEELVRRELEGTFGLAYGGYFLFFGSIEPKKNIGRLIEGYLASGVQTPLVIVGGRAWKSDKELSLLDTEEIREQLRSPDNRASNKILQLQYAPFGLLVTLIRGARAVLFPSLYEGFGLPILEAMLLGTPVLTSNTSSLPEVAGDAALFVNPYSAREIAEGIRTLDTASELRTALVARGLRRAQLFSEAAYQTRLAEVYEKASIQRTRRPRHGCHTATTRASAPEVF